MSNPVYIFRILYISYIIYFVYYIFIFLDMSCILYLRILYSRILYSRILCQLGVIRYSFKISLYIPV
jgi:hypothetical protein